MAGRAMKGALELLKPLLQGSAATTIGTVVIGTVKGDLHDICLLYTSITIRNNLIEEVTNEDWGCVGIGAGDVKNVHIVHNLSLIHIWRDTT